MRHGALASILSACEPSLVTEYRRRASVPGADTHRRPAGPLRDQGYDTAAVKSGVHDVTVSGLVLNSVRTTNR